MKAWKRELAYPVAGVIAIAVLSSINGRAGAFEAVVAWCVCGVALLIDVAMALVADRATGSKITPAHGLIGITRGMVYRLVLVLGCAFLAYRIATGRLGVGYWLAVVVLYQVALTIVVLRMAARLGHRRSKAP